MGSMQQGVSNHSVVTGADDLIAQLRQLSQSVQGAIGRKVMQAGIDVLVNAGQAATPAAKTPGHTNNLIRRSIRGRLVDSGSNGVVQGKVGFNVGQYIAPHAHLYVLGTQERTTTGSGKRVRGRLDSFRPASRGRMPPNDFFAPAIKSAEGDAISVMEQVLSNEIEAQFR